MQLHNLGTNSQVYNDGGNKSDAGLDQLNSAWVGKLVEHEDLRVVSARDLVTHAATLNKEGGRGGRA